jgi:hypothetical protein
MFRPPSLQPARRRHIVISRSLRRGIYSELRYGNCLKWLEEYRTQGACLLIGNIGTVAMSEGRVALQQ